LSILLIEGIVQRAETRPEEKPKMHTKTNRWQSRFVALGMVLISFCWVSAEPAKAQERTPSQQQPFRGGLNPVKDADRPRPVRNDVAQPGEEIVTLRYFKIKKGSFDEFLRVSVEGVWPYLDKQGCRNGRVACPALFRPGVVCRAGQATRS
jgi:hypothetical protein